MEHQLLPPNKAFDILYRQPIGMLECADKILDLIVDPSFLVQPERWFHALATYGVNYISTGRVANLYNFYPDTGGETFTGLKPDGFSSKDPNKWTSLQLCASTLVFQPPHTQDMKKMHYISSYNSSLTPGDETISGQDCINFSCVFSVEERPLAGEPRSNHTRGILPLAEMSVGVNLIEDRRTIEYLYLAQLLSPTDYWAVGTGSNQVVNFWNYDPDHYFCPGLQVRNTGLRHKRNYQVVAGNVYQDLTTSLLAPLAVIDNLAIPDYSQTVLPFMLIDELC